jgi:hypothetical protein
VRLDGSGCLHTKTFRTDQLRDNPAASAVDHSAC